MNKNTTIDFKKGFIFEGVIFGWKYKKLFRLPQIINNRFYPLKECASYDSGFVVYRKRKSFKQLKKMTTNITEVLTKQLQNETPF